MPLHKRTQMTEQERIFARAIACGCSPTDAAKTAGFSHKNLKRIYGLPKRPDVVAYIRELSARCEDELIATAFEARVHMTEILRDKEAAPFARIKAAERLSKMSGWEAPTQSSLTVSGRVEHASYDLSKLSTDEVEKLIEISGKCIPESQLDLEGDITPVAYVEDFSEGDNAEE